MEDMLKKCCQTAGVEYYGWHGFRHTAGCRMANKNVPPQDIKEFMGHSTLRVTEKYLHTRKESKIKAMKILEEYEND